MNYTRTGMVFCTSNYEACVRFYTEVMALPVMFSLDNEYSKLTCVAMAGNYLMIETGGTSVPEGKTLAQNPIWLRFNVDDVETAVKELAAKGVSVDYQKAPWGATASFLDPDGNRCQLREESTFLP
ncbi:MAG: VOC family protein [Chloroflexota bacterium]